jgi:ComF family protein
MDRVFGGRKPHTWWRSFGRAALDLVMPPRCPTCGVRVAEPAALCAACWATVPFIMRPFCEKTATPFALDAGPGAVAPEALQHPVPWQRARAAMRYEGAAAKLVQLLKYGDRHEVVPLMAGAMLRAGGDVLCDADMIIPVPLHPRRLWMRRFNQAALLAHAVGARAGKPVAVDVLRRRKSTPPQVGLRREQRARNMAGAFVVPPSKRGVLTGRRVVLIDDVYTSGATLAAATRALRRAGAHEVDVLVFARVTDIIATA